ncbi:hypothetical protein M9434_000034 [Picochlorum sp. BPE23]|nr:hypothetical protein M9434_000034 [Picochlorum sp. BPE23]
MAFQLVTLTPTIAVARAMPLHRPRAVKNDDLYRLESFFESGVVIQGEEEGIHGSVEAPLAGQLHEQPEDVEDGRTLPEVGERDTIQETASPTDAQGNRAALREGVLKHLSQLQEFRQSSMKAAFSYMRTRSRAIGDAMKKVPVQMKGKQPNETVGRNEGPLVKMGGKESVSVALKKEVQHYKSKLHEYAVGVREETFVKANRAQTTIVQYRESEPILFNTILASVGAMIILGLLRVQHVRKLKKEQELEELRRQDGISRRKRESQRQRFTQMLGSGDQEGVDASVFNAVRQIGASQPEDREDDDNLAEEQAMTPEMEAAWRNFVKDSKLSEGEFWSQDDVFEGFKPLERDEQ